MEEIETELTCSEQDALGADFITVELDTQPIEYVVKWAEVGSKFTISCVKKDLDEDVCLNSDQMFKGDLDETIFVPYESVYPDCDDADPGLIATHEEEVVSESDMDDSTEPEISQPCDDEHVSDVCWEEVSRSRTYNCHICGKRYSHSSSLARHLHVHSDRASHSSKEFGNKKSLQCNMCGVRCNGKRLLAIHKKCHKTKRLHTCNICGKTFNHSSSLSRHRLIHKKGLDKKVRPVYPPPTPAPIMTRHSLSPSQGASKKSNPSGERQKQYQCPQCDRVFSHSAGLSKHQVAHVRKLLNTYTQGKDALDSSSDLKIRLKLCSRDKPNCYTLCKKNKRNREGKKRLCLPNEERPYPCSMCEKRFSHTTSLSRHEHMHASEKHYTCSICKKSFIRLSNLKQHQQTHASGKLYECLQCGKTFVHSSSFSRHKKVHTRIKLSPKLCEEELVIDETAPLEFDSE